MSDSNSNKPTGHICPVCGYPDLDDPAYDQQGNPCFKICTSCSYQFGRTDHDLNIGYELWRQQWIENGMIWDKGRSTPPLNWNPREQLLNIHVKVDDNPS